MKITITPEGVVANEGETIGTITDGVCRLTVKATPVLKGQINAANGSKLTFEADVSDDEGDGDEATSTAAPAVNDPEPEQDPRLGTKTPAWAEWKARQPGQ
mgnify:FL=1